MTMCRHCQQYLVGFLSSSWMTATRKQQNRMQTDNYGICQRSAKSSWLDRTEAIQIFRTFIWEFLQFVSAVFSSFEFRLGVTWELGYTSLYVNTHYDRIACWSLSCLTRSSEHLSTRALIHRPFSALLSILPNSASNWTRSECKSV